MSIPISQLVADLNPDNTVLIFGAGASIPSGVPSVKDLIGEISGRFRIDAEGLTLSEISALAETRYSRRELIDLLREKFKGLKAKGALLNLPLYAWKSIFTTNYDDLVEQVYTRAQKQLTTYTSNFDFSQQSDPLATKLFKLHGTIDKDVVDGHQSRMILTELDYDKVQDYREALYNRLQSDISPGTQVVIVGQSLADRDLRDVVQKSIEVAQRAMTGGRIALLLYTRDENRASLYEQRGLRVAFGGLDELFVELARKAPETAPAFADHGTPLDHAPALRPTTVEVGEECDPRRANPSAIFNGWPATYPDILKQLTFERTCSGQVATLLQNTEALVATLVGASGVGKTSAARQAVLKLQGSGVRCWEHKGEHQLQVRSWKLVEEKLRAAGQRGLLFIDNAHSHLYEVNDLVDALSVEPTSHLKLLLATTRNHWGPRVKTPNLYSRGKEFTVSQLDSSEIERLLTLVESNPDLLKLVDSSFSGFSRGEKRRRLVDRCEADMFVCLKNIFASEKFDDIILREYASLEEASQNIYRLVSAMENSGIRVHRQLVMRVLGIGASNVSAILTSLEDIVSEFSINEREGIYGWRVRHAVIASIITKYKFSDSAQLFALFQKVIADIQPTYDIEIRTIRELCNIESGLAAISDRKKQNVLLRQMMSVAPGERIPRHRLIRNLIDSGDFEQAESEIRIFEKDFGKDGPVARYRILLMVGRARDTPGLLEEDRRVILERAKEFAQTAVRRYDNNKNVLGAYCELGVETFKLTGSPEVYDDAMNVLKKAENRLGDPDVTRMLARYQQRIWA